MDAASGVGYVVRTGQSQCIPVTEEKDNRAVAVDERHLSMVQELGLRSAIIVPLIARGRTLGALTLVAAEDELDHRIRTEVELKRLNETLEQRVAERTAVAEHRAAQLRRLARNLHDDYQQILVAARLQLGKLRPGGQIAQ